MERLVFRFQFRDARVEVVLAGPSHARLQFEEARELYAQDFGQQGLGVFRGQGVFQNGVHDLLFLSLVDREQRGSALHGVGGEVGPQRKTQNEV